LIKRVQKSLLGILFGLCAGSLLILTHNSYPPVGIVLSLLGFLALSILVRRYVKSRGPYICYFISVVVLIYIAATPRASEFLIQGNTEGYLLILGGPIAALLPLIKRVPTK
jgi:predicted Co/Zn/Cd cation transporter (cation efflux family)